MTNTVDLAEQVADAFDLGRPITELARRFPRY